MGRKLGGVIAIAVGVLIAGSASARPSLCDELDQAADELQDATADLHACVQRRDYEEDCSRQARAVRHAADEYESAVSDVSGRVDDIADVCPPPRRAAPLPRRPAPGLFDDVLERPAGR